MTTDNSAPVRSKATGKKLVVKTAEPHDLLVNQKTGPMTIPVSTAPVSKNGAKQSGSHSKERGQILRWMVGQQQPMDIAARFARSKD